MIPIIIYLATIAITTWVQAKVQRTAVRFSAITASAGIAGHQAARRLLDSVGLHHVPVAPSTGPFGDYYDHANRELRLSGNVYGGTSIYSIAVAAHEAGHAVQHEIRYPLLMFRTAVIPVAKYGPGLGYVLMLLGGGILFAGAGSIGLRLTLVGAAVYVLTLALTFASLPIEFNASRRAIALLDSNNLVSSDERADVKIGAGRRSPYLCSRRGDFADKHRPAGASLQIAAPPPAIRVM